jgi:hypothetical protein
MASQKCHALRLSGLRHALAWLASEQTETGRYVRACAVRAGAREILALAPRSRAARRALRVAADAGAGGRTDG